MDGEGNSRPGVGSWFLGRMTEFIAAGNPVLPPVRHQSRAAARCSAAIRRPDAGRAQGRRPAKPWQGGPTDAARRARQIVRATIRCLPGGQGDVGEPRHSVGAEGASRGPLIGLASKPGTARRSSATRPRGAVDVDDRLYDSSSRAADVRMRWLPLLFCLSCRMQNVGGSAISSHPTVSAFRPRFRST